MDHRVSSTHPTYRKVLTVLVTFGLMIHITAILYFTFSKSKDLAGNSAITLVYRYFVHIGPFFREDAIQSSQHVLAGYHKEGNWRYIDMTDSVVKRYRNNPWQTHELSVRDRIRENARSLVGKTDWRNSSDFNRLFHYAETQHPEVSGSDSVSLSYIVLWYKPELKRHVPDTLFDLKFVPPDE